jgi:lipopolysaccharide transport system ATP-binding protein
LTGRENVFLNGAILGMSKAEIKRKFDEIVNFAEVEKFLDTPVKRYSSGMYVRLAFAVAAHLEPEILIVDEVLAVGDAQFQKKCLGKMEDIGKEGRTILFVSHNLRAVQALCNKTILLNSGQLERQGDTQFVVNEYLMGGGGRREILDRVWGGSQESPGNDIVKLFQAHIAPHLDMFEGPITVQTPLRIEFVYSLSISVDFYTFAMHFLTISGECIFITGSSHKMVRPGTYKSTVYIPGDLLNAGLYTMKLFFVTDVTNVLYAVSDLLVFEVHDVERESGWLGEIPGAVRPKLKWDFEPVVAAE